MVNDNRDSTQPDDDQVIGVAWYSETEWAKLAETVADPEILEHTYAEWCSAYTDAVQGLRQAGASCHAVPVSVDVASDWCASMGRPFDAKARAAFVAEKLRRSQEGASGEPNQRVEQTGRSAG